jgi:hypothetical protein
MSSSLNTISNYTHVKAKEDKPVTGNTDTLEKSMLPLDEEETRVGILCSERYMPDDTPERPADPLLRSIPNENLFAMV